MGVVGLLHPADSAETHLLSEQLHVFVFPAALYLCCLFLYVPAGSRAHPTLPLAPSLALPPLRCLFEALQAVSAHVPMDLLVEDVQSGQTLDKLHQLFTKVSQMNHDTPAHQ